MKPYIVMEQFGKNHLVVGDNIPTIRFGGLDIIICSLGAPAKECRDMAENILKSVNEAPLLQAVADAAKAVYNCWTSGIPHNDGMARNAEQAYLEAWSALKAHRNGGGE